MSRLQAIPHVWKIKQVQENSKLRGTWGVKNLINNKELSTD